MIGTGQVLVPLLGGFLAGACALLTVLWLVNRGEPHPVALARADPLGDPRTFVFRNGYLLDHSNNVGFLLPDPVDRMTAWADLQKCLRHISPDLGPALRDLAAQGTAFRVDGPFGEDRFVVCGHRDGEDLNVTVSASTTEQTAVRIDKGSLDALAAERDTLARATETSPALSWAIDATGHVVWSNAAYRTLIDRCAGPDAARGWPLRRLFPDSDAPLSGRTRRKCLTSDGTEVWYDVTLSPPDIDGLSHGHAISLDAVIRAEDSLRAFIQTLTKSFAALPTGLAIFDKTERLVLFNPALLDMTGLDGAWLLRHPRLTEVFEALRDRQKIPEPPEYEAWIGRLATKASDVALPHVENWTLADGTNHRLTAQIQSDGATTLLLEDVSASVLVEHRSRRDHAMLTQMLDMADAGVVAFDATGKRTVTNATAQALWFDGTSSIPLPTTLAGCLTLWTAKSRPTPLWGEIRTLVQGPFEERAAWDQDLVLADGTAVAARVMPQADGGLAVVLRSDRDPVGLAPIRFDRPALMA